MQLENRAEVGLLDRNIQIQGDDAALGCRVLLAPGSQTTLQGVSITGCGQLTSGDAALQIEGASEAVVANCTMLDSKAAGVVARGSNGLQLQNNVIVGSAGSSVSVLDSSNVRWFPQAGVHLKQPANWSSLLDSSYCTDSINTNLSSSCSKSSDIEAWIPLTHKVNSTTTWV